MTVNMDERIQSFSDNELLAMYENEYFNYTTEVLKIAKEEINHRGIHKKTWFYRKNDEQLGPYTRDEIADLAKKMELRPIDYIWHEGLDDWVAARTVSFLDFNSNQSLENNRIKPPDFKYTQNRIKTPEINYTQNNLRNKQTDDAGKSGIKVAAILVIIIGVLWGIIAFAQMIMSFFNTGIDVSLIAGWNIVMSIGMIVIGIAIFNLKSWSYGWGIGTAVLNLFLHVFQLLFYGVNITIIFIPMYVAILVILKKNKKIFKILEIAK
jgi:uncharacterized protein DUF4339